MDITSQSQAQQYIASWRADLDAGLNAVSHGRCAWMFRYAADSQNRCAAIRRSQGALTASADHAAACAFLNTAADYHAQQATIEEENWLRQREETTRQEDERIATLRHELGLDR